MMMNVLIIEINFGMNCKNVYQKCIPANSVSSLLKILCSCYRSDVLTFPKDVKTFMSNSKTTISHKKIGNYDNYNHFGLRNKWLSTVKLF